ncbi:phosphate uptake regulator PhoU [Archaeoglobales archaeon]|nr:MAG: phosphate uptake regulator PhoU [Archaeoglobales archaeon]
MKVRKLQLVGRSSYMVSLPKDWISKYNLKQGDEVILNEYDDTIIIQPQKGEKEEIKVTVKEVPSYNKKFLKKFLGAIYSLGVDKIEIIDENAGEHITEISELSHHYIGMEVLDATNEKIVLHCFTIPDFDVLTIIRRMFQILSGIISEIKSFLVQEKEDDIESRIRRYEDDFDRLYLLSVRLVNRGMKKIAIPEWDELRFLLGSRIVSKFFEEIADLLFILSRYLINSEPDVRREISSSMPELEELFKMGFDSFTSSDIKTVQEFLENVEKVSQEIHNSIDNGKAAILKELMLQICRMLESIGEIAFNKSVREMFRT